MSDGRNESYSPTWCTRLMMALNDHHVAAWAVTRVDPVDREGGGDGRDRSASGRRQLGDHLCGDVDAADRDLRDDSTEVGCRRVEIDGPRDRKPAEAGVVVD